MGLDSYISLHPDDDLSEEEKSEITNYITGLKDNL
ncbi:heme-binding domain-containing protein [Salinimicrobium sp. CDJ15-81-2]|nr:heme-binding domain-containing protein [Salinimicrobium nanhaiense]